MVNMETEMVENEGGIEERVAGVVTPLVCLERRLECGIRKDHKKKNLDMSVNR